MENSSEHKNTAGPEVQAHQADDGTFELVMSDTGRMAAASRAPDAPHGGGAAVEDAAAPAHRRLKPLGFLLLAAGLLLVAILVYAFAGTDDDSGDAVTQASSNSDGFKPYREGPAGSAIPLPSSRALGRTERTPENAPQEPSPEAHPLMDSRRDFQDDEVPEELQEDLQGMRQQQEWELQEAREYDEPESGEVLEDRQEDRAIEEEEENAVDDEIAADEELDNEETSQSDELAPEEDLDESQEYNAQEVPAAQDNNARRLIRAPQLQRVPSRRFDRIKIRQFGAEEQFQGGPQSAEENEGSVGGEAYDEYEFEGEGEAGEGDDRVPGFGRD